MKVRLASLDPSRIFNLTSTRYLPEISLYWRGDGFPVRVVTGRGEALGGAAASLDRGGRSHLWGLAPPHRITPKNAHSVRLTFRERAI